jgi:hypothetical protein
MRGFLQILGRDFTKTFVLTVRIDSLRILLTIVVIKDLKYYQINIKNAFTKSKLKKQIFISLLSRVKTKLGYMLKVLQSLYRLKQAV